LANIDAEEVASRVCFCQFHEHSPFSTPDVEMKGDIKGGENLPEGLWAFEKSQRQGVCVLS
jgi:hypothetical protein